jgi:hypothetical protein
VHVNNYREIMESMRWLGHPRARGSFSRVAVWVKFAAITQEHITIKEIFEMYIKSVTGVVDKSVLSY